jgi:hypothetical protein
LVAGSKSQDIAAGKAYDRSISSATAAANIAENGQFASQITAWSKEQTKLILRMDAFVRAAAAQAGRPIELYLDSKLVYRATLAQASKAGRR